MSKGIVFDGDTSNVKGLKLKTKRKKKNVTVRVAI